MIDEKKLIEKIGHRIFKSDSEAYIFAIQETIETIENFPKVGEWIPVEERLPENAGYSCLATIENKFGQKTVAKVFTSYGVFGDGFWLCNEKDIDLKVWKVIAWMPLPNPYRKEDEE